MTGFQCQNALQNARMISSLPTAGAAVTIPAKKYLTSMSMFYLAMPYSHTLTIKDAASMIDAAIAHYHCMVSELNDMLDEWVIKYDSMQDMPKMVNNVLGLCQYNIRVLKKVKMLMAQK